jgi:hypothetical protein
MSLVGHSMSTQYASERARKKESFEYNEYAVGRMYLRVTTATLEC